jgi:hypothetical protein
MLPAATVWILVALTGPISARPVVQELYRTADKAACDEQAAEWNKQLVGANAVFACLQHRQKVFLSIEGAAR